MSDDLGSGNVVSIHKETGYPMDRWGHLINPISDYDGSVVPDWDKAGTKLYNFTNPYGFLAYCVGSGDDFYCFDFCVINAGPRGEFIILDATINSETGSFIQGGEYFVMPINTAEERLDAVRTAADLVAYADNWMDDTQHDRRGWNQDERYFLRSVAAQLFEYRFKKYEKKTHHNVDAFSERQLRFGGKKIEEVMDFILHPTLLGMCHDCHKKAKPEHLEPRDAAHLGARHVAGTGCRRKEKAKA